MVNGLDNFKNPFLEFPVNMGFPHDCWKPSTNEDGEEVYELKDDGNCFQLECGHNYIKPTFKSNLFGIRDGDMNMPFGNGMEPEWAVGMTPEWNSAKSQWELRCGFKQCKIYSTYDDE